MKSMDFVIFYPLIGDCNNKVGYIHVILCILFGINSLLM